MAYNIKAGSSVVKNVLKNTSSQLTPNKRIFYSAK